MPSRLAIVFAFFATAACSKSPAAPTVQPTPIPMPACQANQTATVTFKNTARSSTHTVLLDGVTVATLAPGQESARLTAAASVAHTVEFRVTNTTRLACVTTHPIWAICANEGLTCSGD